MQVVRDSVVSYGIRRGTTEREILTDKKPFTFKNMEGSDYYSCREMSDLHQRLYHYLKPFKKSEEKNGNN